MSRTSESPPEQEGRAFRWLAVAAGGLMITASSVAIILAAGQDVPHGALTAAMGVGILAGSATVGRALSARRKGLALVTILALLAGEAFSTLSTADRIVGEREATQAAHRRAHRYAEAELARAKAAHDEAVKAKLAKASDVGCKDRCVALLTSAEVAAKADLDVARQRWDANPKPEVSASALADRLGVPA